MKTITFVRLAIVFLISCGEGSVEDSEIFDMDDVDPPEDSIDDEILDTYKHYDIRTSIRMVRQIRPPICTYTTNKQCSEVCGGIWKKCRNVCFYNTYKRCH